MDHDGGGLFIERLSFNILNTTFNKNIARKHEGGVTVRSSNPLFQTITFKNSSFKAKEGGGAYFNNSIGESPLWKNVATINAGGNINMGTNLIGCFFANNEASKYGGAVAIISHYETQTILLILDSQFKHNSAARLGGHLTVHSWTEGFNITAHIAGCVLEGGSAERGGAISIWGTSRESPSWESPSWESLKHFEITVILANCTLRRNNATSGGAVDIRLLNLKTQFNNKVVVYVKAHYFTEIVHNYANNGSGLNILVEMNGTLYIDISNSSIAYNRANSGSIVQVYAKTIKIITEITLTNVHFFKNTFSHPYNSAVIQFNNMNISLTTNGATFTYNNGSCIAAKESTIALQGQAKFMYNTAYIGAALFLDCPADTGQPSFLILLPNTTVTIANNTALYYGGGLAVNPVCEYSNSCFYQGSARLNSVMSFRDNKAFVAGSSIYGPSAQHCGTVIDNLRGFDAFVSLFQVEGGYTTDHVILAPINSVCFCEISCNTELEVSVWAGTEFEVSALVTGMLNDTSGNFIRASLTNVGDSEGKSRIPEIQKIQEIQRSCKKLTYSVKTLAKSVQIKLRIDAIEDSHPSYINITILQCPLGFQPGKSNKKCICSEYLLTKIPDISCNIVDNNGHISVPGKTWIGNYSDKLAIHRHCPLDYCNPKLHSIDLRIQQQHLQCTNNRSGVLCGACQTGLSLGLGTARCLDHCSNYITFSSLFH